MPSATQRLAREVANFKDSTEFALRVKDDNLRDLRLFMHGPSDTPYAGCVLVFSVTVPDRFPFVPPVFKLLSTGGGKVRLNPNLYANGKVCVTVLGTFSASSSEGEIGWTPALQLTGVAAAVQSLLSADPYHNEPGFESCVPSQRAAAGAAKAKASDEEQQKRHQEPWQTASPWSRGRSIASPAAVREFFDHTDSGMTACCRYGTKIRHEALRLGVLAPLLFAIGIRHGRQSADDALAECKSLRDLGISTFAELSERVCGQRIHPGDYTDGTIAGEFADFAESAFTADKLAAIVDECDRLGQYFKAEGTEVARAPFEGEGNQAPGRVFFSRLAKDLRHAADVFAGADSMRQASSFFFPDERADGLETGAAAAAQEAAKAETATTAAASRWKKAKFLLAAGAIAMTAVALGVMSTRERRRRR